MTSPPNVAFEAVGLESRLGRVVLTRPAEGDAGRAHDLETRRRELRTRFTALPVTVLARARPPAAWRIWMPTPAVSQRELPPRAWRITRRTWSNGPGRLSPRLGNAPPLQAVVAKSDARDDHARSMSSVDRAVPGLSDLGCYSTTATVTGELLVIARHTSSGR